MKMSLEWHRGRVPHIKNSIADAQKQLDWAIERKTRLDDMLDLTLRQIAEAERRGLDGFDQDKLLVVKKRKVPAQ